MGNQGLEKDKPLFKVPSGEGWEQRWLGGRLLLKNSILQPGVLAPRPAVLLACCDSGSLRLGFLICVVRGLEKISEGFPIQWTLSWVSTLCLAESCHMALPPLLSTCYQPGALPSSVLWALVVKNTHLWDRKDWSPIPAIPAVVWPWASHFSLSELVSLICDLPRLLCPCGENAKRTFRKCYTRAWSR